MLRCGVGGVEQWGREAPKQICRDERSHPCPKVTSPEKKEITSSHSLNTLSPSGLCQTCHCALSVLKTVNVGAAVSTSYRGGDGSLRGELSIEFYILCHRKSKRSSLPPCCIFSENKMGGQRSRTPEGDTLAKAFCF